MAFAVAPTLNEVRREVAIRTDFGAKAELSPTLKDRLDSYIRQAARMLLTDCAWVEQRVRYRLPLIYGQGIYDWPDNMDVGRLERLVVVSTSGEEVRLKAGVHPEERSLFLRSGVAGDLVNQLWPDETGEYEDVTVASEDLPVGMPLRYEVVNKNLAILPLPDTDRYPTLLVEGYASFVEPRMGSDQIPVDKEALVQQAVVLASVKKPEYDRLKSHLKDYVATLKPMQGDGETIHVGGHFSRKFRYTRGRHVGGSDKYTGNYWLEPGYRG